MSAHRIGQKSVGVRNTSGGSENSATRQAKSPIDIFHDHLHVCKQCEQHPFELCATGSRLIQEAVTTKFPA